MTTSTLALVLLAVAGWAAGTDNGLVTLRNLLEEAWRQIDVALTPA